MKEPIRILHVLQRMEAGGTQALLMNIYRNIDRSKIQFDFLVEYPNEEFYDSEIRELGGKVFYSNVRKDKNIPKFKKQLKELINKYDYKIIHVHTYSIGYFVLKTAKQCGVPVRIAHSHSNNMTNDIKKYLKKVLQKLYPKYATNFMACSKEAGDYLFKNKNFVVLNNTIDSEKFIFSEKVRNRIRNELGINEKFVVGHVGRFKPEKNHSFLIDVFYEIKQMKKDAVLLMIGNGDSNKTVMDKIKRLSLEKDVILLQNRTNVNELYQAMDVFVFPSIYEGLGIVAIEAQAAGIPCVCSSGLPKESKVTNLCEILSLDEGAKKWAEVAINNSKNKLAFTNTQKDIINANYDINFVVKNIENYYLRLYAENLKEKVLKNEINK